MTVDERWEFPDVVQVQYRKKGSSSSSSSRPARIVVTRGKLEIRFADDKIPANIILKTSNIVKLPKRPGGQSVTWLSMDIVQNVEAKYTFINLQVDLSKMDSFVDTLRKAWETKSTGMDVFSDNADEICAPVHKPPPNANLKPASIPALSRAERQRIKVDPEGSAVHSGFQSDFNVTTTHKPVQTASALKDIFNEYGFNENNDPGKPPQPVHSQPPRPAPPKNVGRAGLRPPPSSYASQARRSDKHYKPVDSAGENQSLEKKEGLPEQSFYGSNQTTPNQINRTTPKVRRNGPLDGGVGTGNVQVTQGTPARKSLLALLESCPDEPVMPIPSSSEKSLTSTSAVAAFDATTKKPSVKGALSSSSSNIQRPGFLRTNNPVNPLSLNTTNRSTRMVDSPPRTFANFYSGYDKYAYKILRNVNNSCYINSSLQILAACPIFVQRLNSAVQSLSRRSEVIEQFDHLMQWLTRKGESKRAVEVAVLEKARDCFTQLSPQLSENFGKSQQDADELLMKLLDAVSDECSGKGIGSSERRRSNDSHSPVKSPTKSAHSQADSPHKSIGDGNRPKAIHDPVSVIEIVSRNVKRCESCGHSSAVEATEHREHLEIENWEDSESPGTVKCVQQLLAGQVFTKETIGDCKCEGCGKKGYIVGTKEYVRFGEYIIIAFKRSGYNKYGKSCKLTTPIRPPLFIEMGDFIHGEKKGRDMNVTITLEEKKSEDEEEEEEMDADETQMTEQINATNRVVDRTQEWLEEGEKESPVKNLAEQLSNDLLEGDDEEEKEGRATPIQEDSVVPFSPTKTEEAMVEGKEEATEPRPSPRPSFPPTPQPIQLTPTKKKNPKMDTPGTVREVRQRTRRSNETVEHDGTPSRKRHDRATTARVEERKEKDKWLDARKSSLSSLSHSEPSRYEKKSRVNKTAFKCPIAKTPTAPAEVVIEDSDEDERERARRSSDGGEKRKPCWAAVKENLKNSTPPKMTKDAFEFDADEDDNGERRPIGNPKRGRIGSEGGGPRKRNKPLRDAKGTNEGSPVERARRRSNASENASPMSKSTMEQTGGGGREKKKKKIRSESESEETERGENEAMEVEDGKEENEEKELPATVTRRSRARNERRTRDVEKKKEEEEMGDDKDSLLGDGDGPKMEDEEETELKDEKDNEEEEMESSADGVVNDTLPEEREEEEEGGRGDEEESMEDGKADDEVMESTEDEKEEEDVKTLVASETSSLLDEAACFDTPAAKTLVVTSANVSTRKSRSSTANADGEVKPVDDLELSPVKSASGEKLIEGGEMDGETRNEGDVEPEGEQDEEMGIKEEEETETAEERKAREHNEGVWRLKKKRDKIRKNWRKLFADTYPPPPPGYIMFRPVDEIWMESQCELHQMKYTHNIYSHSDTLREVRAQSNLCEVDKAPGEYSTLDIDGDGNCLFRALSWWVTGSEDQHVKMRKRIVYFMMYFPEEFGARMTGREGQLYTMENNDRMLYDGEWGTQCELYGAATLFGVDIYTYHEKRWKQYRPLFEWSYVDGHKITRVIGPHERTRYGIYLANDNNLHYDVVKYMEPAATKTETCYRLVGAINHLGPTINSGHYTANIYDQATEKWLHCDDDEISTIKTIEVLAEATEIGYVFVYAKNSSIMKKKKNESSC